MASSPKPIIVATRGSALALAQARRVLAQCRGVFPDLHFELKIIKTTGDKLQGASLQQPSQEGTKGLFTKELETALLSGEADLAVHSLKDLPTELPEGLHLGAVSERADARDVLVHRADEAGLNGSETGVLPCLKEGATVATSSTRRQAQLQAMRPDLRVVPIRGNVGTRLRKLVDQGDLDALILAAAGLARLDFLDAAGGGLRGEEVPEGLRLRFFSVEEMIPCVGQAAIGIETRVEDGKMADLCSALNHVETEICVRAERAFLRAMGGGCLSPVAALASTEGDRIRLRAVSLRDGVLRRAEVVGARGEGEELGQEAARRLKAG